MKASAERCSGRSSEKPFRTPAPHRSAPEGWVGARRFRLGSGPVRLTLFHFPPLMTIPHRNTKQPLQTCRVLLVTISGDHLSSKAS